MMNDVTISWIAFSRTRCLGAGTPSEVAAAVKAHIDNDAEANVLVFDRVTSEPVELDLRGSVEDVVARVAASLPVMAMDSAAPPEEPPVAVARTAGRPRLGVVAREVTLLPRHWAWLATQSGGASVALRKLVEQALRSSADADRVRKAKESTYRFVTAIAGNEQNHEEAIRALFAGDLATFGKLIVPWPTDIREHALSLAQSAESAESAESAHSHD